MTLLPGKSDSFTINVNAYACGDTSTDRKTSLPAGSYTVRGVMAWSTHKGGSASGLWVTGTLPLTVQSK